VTLLPLRQMVDPKVHAAKAVKIGPNACGLGHQQDFGVLATAEFKAPVKVGGPDRVGVNQAG